MLSLSCVPCGGDPTAGGVVWLCGDIAGSCETVAVVGLHSCIEGVSHALQ